MIYQKLTLGFVRSAPVFAALMQQPVRHGDHLEARAGEHSRRETSGLGLVGPGFNSMRGSRENQNNPVRNPRELL